MNEPYYQNGQVTLLLGEVREMLREMADESVNCVVTSPPYWSLRDYGIEPSVWGADDPVKCSMPPVFVTSTEHEWSDGRPKEGFAGTKRWQHTVDGPDGDKFRGREDDPEAWEQVTQGGVCSSCGAWRGELGLEPTIEMYVSHVVEVFREVRRVLTRDGTLWLNLGDSYAGSWGASGYKDSSTYTGSSRSRNSIRNQPKLAHPAGTLKASGLKAKDLAGIPWRVALALQADGWWLRSDIIWSKPNPMPESAKDRPTKAHEYLFLLTKSARYHYDHEAIKEKASSNTHARARKLRATGSEASAPTAERNGVRPPGVGPKAAPAGSGTRYNESFSAAVVDVSDDRNKRSVWTVPTAPYAKAHFATFPPDLIRPCILAGVPPDGVVLDPFVGSGTVCMVASEYGRRSIGIDLKAEYLNMAVERSRQMGMALETGAS